MMQNRDEASHDALQNDSGEASRHATLPVIEPDIDAFHACIQRRQQAALDLPHAPIAGQADEQLFSVRSEVTDPGSEDPAELMADVMAALADPEARHDQDDLHAEYQRACHQLDSFRTSLRQTRALAARQEQALQAKDADIARLQRELADAHARQAEDQQRLHTLEADTAAQSAEIGHLKNALSRQDRQTREQLSLLAATEHRLTTLLQEQDASRSALSTRLEALTGRHAELQARLDRSEARNVDFLQRSLDAAVRQSAGNVVQLRQTRQTRQRDDLTELDGLGAVSAAELGKHGIHSFERLAALDPDALGRLAKPLAPLLTRMRRHDWVGQARQRIGSSSPRRKAA